MKNITDREIKELEIKFAELYDYVNEELILSDDNRQANKYADLLFRDLERAKLNLKAMIKELGL